MKNPVFALVVLFSLVSAVRTIGQGILIDSVDVDSKYNASYLLSYSSVYLYNVDGVGKDRIRRVISQFETSGLYDRVEWKLVRFPNRNSTKLVLKPIYPRQYESFVFHDVVVDGIPGLDETKFRRVLEREGVTFGSLWHLLSYREIVSKIGVALAEAVNGELGLKEIQSPWISVKKDRLDRVILTVHGSSFDHMAIFNDAGGE